MQDPFKAFGVYVDQLGEHLSEKQIGIIEEELPLGLAYMVMLIIPMAKTWASTFHESQSPWWQARKL